MDNNNRNNKQDLKLNIAPDVAKGNYSNLAVITHSPSEVILDFAQIMPGSPNANVCSRVVMSPVHAKRLLNALADNIQKYERTYGTITEPQQLPIDGDTIPYDVLGKA